MTNRVEQLNAEIRLNRRSNMSAVEFDKLLLAYETAIREECNEKPEWPNGVEL